MLQPPRSSWRSRLHVGTGHVQSKTSLAIRHAEKMFEAVSRFCSQSAEISFGTTTDLEPVGSP